MVPRLARARACVTDLYRAPAGADAGWVPPGGGAGRLNRLSEHVDPSHFLRYTGRTRERAQRAKETKH